MYAARRLPCPPALALLFLATLARLALSGIASAEERWFGNALVGIETGPTGAEFGGDAADPGYATRFDGREIVRRAVDAQCDYLVLWARDGVHTYYDSELQPKAPGLGERDVLREAVGEAPPHQHPDPDRL